MSFGQQRLRPCTCLSTQWAGAFRRPTWMQRVALQECMPSVMHHTMQSMRFTGGPHPPRTLLFPPAMPSQTRDPQPMSSSHHSIGRGLAHAPLIALKHPAGKCTLRACTAHVIPIKAFSCKGLPTEVVQTYQHTSHQCLGPVSVTEASIAKASDAQKTTR